MLSPCPPDKILNVTGKCVKKTGRIGKKLLKQQALLQAPQELLQELQPPCPPDKILNVTGKCVKKTGRIGRKLLKQEALLQAPQDIA